MFNVGPLEVAMIFVVALLVFGPQKLPEIGRQVGRGIREFRKFQASLQHEFKDAFDDPIRDATRPLDDPMAVPQAEVAPEPFEPEAPASPGPATPPAGSEPGSNGETRP